MATPKVIPRWFPLPFLILGAYIVLVSFGVLPYTPSTRKRAVFNNPHHWQIASIGIAFFFAGVSIIVANRGRWLAVLLGTVFLVAFGAPMVWFFYFSGVVSLPMRFIASIPLAIGGAGALFGLVRTAQGKSATVDIARDPANDADALVAYGRTAQAEAVLRAAIQRHPSRAAEFQRKLDEIHRNA